MMTKMQRKRLAEAEALLREGRIQQALRDLLALREETRGARQGWQVLEVLAEAYKLIGDAEGAASALFQAAQEDEYLRSQREHYSGYLFALHYLDGVSAEDLAQAHKVYAGLYRDEIALPPRGAVSHERLRVGFLAPAFCVNAVMRFAEPLLLGLSREHFEVWAYALSEAQDEFSRKLAREVHYVSLAGLAVDEAAERIRSDEIDILLDLGGHSAGGCTLFIMAQRPAPVQLAGIGYFDTWGLPPGCVDGLLADSTLVQAGEEGRFMEPLWKLPQALVFQPSTAMQELYYRKPPLSASPPPRGARKRGMPVASLDRDHRRWWWGATTAIREHSCLFGVFQNALKITEKALSAWQKILQAVPQGKLLIQDTLPLAERAASLEKRIAEAGLPMERVEVRVAQRDFLEDYAQMDIILDTFPYPGGYMTATALYLGMPVVTLAGDRYGSRMGASLLKAVGHAEWVAHSVDEYVQKAVDLAEDKNRLLEIKSELRKGSLSSPLFDVRAYLQSVERSLLEMARRKGVRS